MKVIRNSENTPVATMSFSDKLVISAADLQTAQQIMTAVSKPYSSATSVYEGNASFYIRVIRQPGTYKHYTDFGLAGASIQLLASLNLHINVTAKDPPLKFPVQVEYPSP